VKRFTETSKWSDPWYRALTPTAKLLWAWLCDNCDNAAVIDPDIMLATFQIGDKIEDKHFAEFGDRIKRLPNGKIWIPKFIKFQFGELSQTSKVHASVIRLLQSHGIDYPMPLLSDRNENLIGGSSPKAKEKDKDKVKDKDTETWLNELQASPAYNWIDVKNEFEKAKHWILSHNGRQLNKRFFVNWLNRIEKPLESKVAPKKDLDLWPGDNRFSLTKAPPSNSPQGILIGYNNWKMRRLAQKGVQK
jgi:hypothetical protein